LSEPLTDSRIWPPENKRVPNIIFVELIPGPGAISMKVSSMKVSPWRFHQKGKATLKLLCV